MKVLMFGWEFPPYISGGLGTACDGLTRALTRQKVDITFVLPKLHGHSTSSHVKLVGANHVRVKQERRLIRTFKKTVEYLEIDSPLAPYMSGDEYDKLVTVLKKQREEEVSEEIVEEEEVDPVANYGDDMMSELVKYSIVAGIVAKSRKFDVIHAHDWMTYLAGIEAKKVTGKPLVVHVHSLEHDRAGDFGNDDIRKIELAGMEAADLIIAVSHFTMDKIVKQYGIPESKIRVVHNAVSREKQLSDFHVKKPLKEKLVLFLGRITFQKGPEYFIEAARRVLKKVGNVRFVMAGSGDLFPRMVDRMALLRLGEKFHFTGFLKGPDVERVYAMSDVFVMPSVSEPFGIAPLEAMAYNVPIIVSKQSGVAEILDHAIKVDFWDVDKLAESIIMVLNNPALAREMVDGSNRQLTRIKWELAADKVRSVYQEVAAVV